MLLLQFLSNRDEKTLMITSQRFTYICFLTFLLSSCGREYGSDALEGTKVGQTLNIEQRILDPIERNIALRLCESYRSKWIEFRLSKLNDTFSYDYEAKLCDGDVKEVNPFETSLKKSSEQNDSPLLFDSDQFIDYVQNMETHMHGDLSLICDPLMKKGETPQKSYVVNNQTKQFSFKEVDSQQDFYVVYTTQRQELEEGDRDVIVAQESYKVLTRPNSADSDFKGLVTLSERIKPCSDDSPQELATFTQKSLLP